jgi:hypothetical protein
VHFLEILGFDLLFSHELVLIPEPNQSQPGFKIETDPQFDARDPLADQVLTRFG